jgi:hypothetical protein
MMTKIVFALLAVFVAGAAQAETTPAPAKVTDRRSPDFVRCVSAVETGSLVKRHKTCRTNAEWDRIETEERRNADGVIDGARRAITTAGTGA